MGKFANGKYAQFISDRSGMAFPYLEMVREWTGARVHVSEYEPKQPQVDPRPHGADAQALPNARPRSPGVPTADFLPNNPFKLLSSKIDVSHPNSEIQVGDQVRLMSVEQSIPYTSLIGAPAALRIQDIELSTTLAADITASDTTLNLTDFIPTAVNDGFLMIQKINSTTGLFENEIIKYTSRTTLGGTTYSGLTRGTNAPFRGVTPTNTTASAHSAGAKVFCSRKVLSLNTTTSQTGAQPSTVTNFNGYILDAVISPLSETKRSGGENCTAGPLNINTV